MAIYRGFILTILVATLGAMAVACGIFAPEAGGLEGPAGAEETRPLAPPMMTPPTLPATAYYVAPTGNDANPGTEAQPWRTIGKAASTLTAGDTVYIKAGTYHERVVPQHSGSAGQFITYAAYPGHQVTVDGSGVTMPDWGGLFDLSGRDYIRVTGLRIVNSAQAGIFADTSKHILIENNYTYNTVSSGIGVWNSQDIVIAGNEVVLACNDGDQEDITIAGTDSFQVHDNHIHNGGPGTHGGEGIDVKDGSSNGRVYRNHVHHLQRVGIYVDAWDKHTHDIEVYQNVVHDIAAMGISLASEMGGLLENVRVYNNIVYHNRYVGIWLSGCCPESSTHPVREIQIVNNTLYDNGWQDWGGGIGIENAEVQTVTLRNNLVSQNLYFQIALDPAVPSQQVTVDHNLIDDYRGTEGEIRGDDYVEGDPRFVNAAAANLHLQPDSPAVDRGAAQGAPDADFDGDPRPQDGDGDGTAGYDIGADEVLASVSRIYLPTVVKSSPTPSPAGLCPGPEPALVTDLQVRQPPALAEPAPRAPFRDPVFGRCVVRVTDRTGDKTEPGGLKNEYSRVQSFNADETRLLVMSTQGGWYLYNAQTLRPLGPLSLGVDPRWSATDPNLIYFSEETRLMSYNLATQQTAVVHEFADDLPGQNLAAVWTRYEGNPSHDGRWWGLMAEDGEWLTAALLVYDLTTDQVTATLDTRGWSADAREIDSVTISPLGNYFLVYMDLYCPPGQLGTPANPCGLMVYDRNLQNGRGLLRIVGHSDTALDAQGREVLVYQDIDTDQIAMLDLASGAVTPLWPIDFTYTGIGLHISGRGLDRPGWAVISTHDGDAASHTWMDDQVFLIELEADGRVVRLAHTHSLVDEAQEHDYWAEPQASANHDLSRVLFTSNWGRSGTEGVEMYLIELPADWPARLP